MHYEASHEENYEASHEENYEASHEEKYEASHEENYEASHEENYEVTHKKNYEYLWKIEENLREIEHLSITRKNTIQYLLCQRIIEPFYMNKTLNRTNVKPVVNHDSLTSTYDHNPCLYSCRLTARKLRQSNIIRYRDRAPSRVCFKKIMRAMKNRKCRQKVKQFLKHSTPTSSVLNHIAINYKEYYLKFIHRHKFLSQSFAALKHIHKAKKRICTSHHPTTTCVLNSSTILKNAIFDNDKFCAV